MTVVDENTKMPVKVTWTIVALVSSGVFWVAVMYGNLSSAQADIHRLQTDLRKNEADDTKREREHLQVLHSIDNRLSRIEERMNIPGGRQ